MKRTIVAFGELFIEIGNYSVAVFGQTCFRRCFRSGWSTDHAISSSVVRLKD